MNQIRLKVSDHVDIGFGDANEHEQAKSESYVGTLAIFSTLHPLCSWGSASKKRLSEMVQ